ncbi:MAG: hypothetical protein ABF296_03390 [Oceanococcaceae bacterium]
MLNSPHRLTWLLTIFLLVGQVVGVHAHACSDGDIDCLQESHADALVHASESCAEESCVDTRVEVGDGVLAKLLDFDDAQLLAIVVVGILGLLLFSKGSDIPVERVASHNRNATGLPPPARAPPLTL